MDAAELRSTADGHADRLSHESLDCLFKSTWHRSRVSEAVWVLGFRV